ncbi:elongation factor Ts [Buchnera aphidicola (Cinara tujafilina)]|uniref:Elongation factor Ts n=1 Tax=Buchnera aphidicola (Cinara tujafilina) TaxID=261317 RepID=F7WZ82_9GAMM|nr:translation elongation factor Ts [Buchnera aphidicola]AEH39736.1 elongation factor Ts [Buchnera aphidicola (Cinara tujafilina)]
MDHLFLLIKELRKKTGSGLIDCKNALIHTRGDINKAIDYLRSSGTCLALNKLSNKTTEGGVFVCIHNTTGFILELNAETDFVTHTNEFKKFGQELVNYASKHDIDNVNVLKKIFKKEIVSLITKVSENIKINRIKKIFGNIIISYIHMNKIGVLVASSNLELSLKQKECMKNIAMHIVALNPICLTQKEIPQNIIDRELSIQTELAKKTGKSALLLQRIIDGRMKKFINNNTLLNQKFVMDIKKNIREFLEENKVSLSGFIRLQVGTA